MEFSALQQNIVVNWVIEAAFLRAATRKKGSREFKSHVVLLTVNHRKQDATSIFLGDFFARLIFEGDFYSRATSNSSIRLGSQPKTEKFFGLRHFVLTYDERKITNGQNVLCDKYHI